MKNSKVGYLDFSVLYTRYVIRYTAFNMTLDALIMFSGALIALIPFLGFPLKWDNVILVVLGVFIIALGIVIRRRGLVKRSAINKGNGTLFVESVPQRSVGTHAER